jgi:ketosteroid isomerase-like protein
MSHFRFVQDWLEGWNSRNPDRIMAHYADDAIFQQGARVGRSSGCLVLLSLLIPW